MKKKLLIILITVYCLLASGLFPRLAFADRELDDYLYQYEKYQEIYDQFKISRDKFLKYEALSVSEATRADTETFILKRNLVLRTYFLLLKNRLRNTPGVMNPQAKEDLLSLLDKKIVWLEEESEEVENLENPSFEDLFILSGRIEDKDEEMKNLGYQALAEMILGKIRSLQQESTGLTALLKDEVFENKSATQAAQLDLWLREVSVKNYLAQKEIEAAEINLWNLRSAKKETSMINFFNNLKTDADDAKIQLNQALSFLKEILAQLNYD